MTDPIAASGTEPNPDAGDAGPLAEGVGPGVGLADEGKPVQGRAQPLDFAKTLREYEAKLLRYAATLLGNPLAQTAARN